MTVLFSNNVSRSFYFLDVFGKKEEFCSSLVMLLNSSPCQPSASDPLLTFLFSAECLLVPANELGDVGVLIYLPWRTSTVL